MKCHQSHLTNPFQNPRDTVATCAIYGAPHSANLTDCQIRRTPQSIPIQNSITLPTLQTISIVRAAKSNKPLPKKFPNQERVSYVDLLEKSPLKSSSNISILETLDKNQTDWNSSPSSIAIPKIASFFFFSHFSLFYLADKFNHKLVVWEWWF